MKHSIGKTIPAATDTTLFVVPPGYVAHVSLVFISNTSGSTGSVTFHWEHGHDASHKIYILNSKTISSKDYLQFSEGLLIMKEGDSLIFNPTNEMNVIVTFDLLQRQPLYTFDGE